MPSGQVIRVRRAGARDDSVAATTLRDGIRQIQVELKVTPDFPPEVQRAADAAATGTGLPDQVRPALLWTMTLDAAGAVMSTGVERTKVRSVAKLDYAGLQQHFDDDRFDGAHADSVRLLKTIGELRLQQEEGPVSGPPPLPLGTDVSVQLTEADVTKRRIGFTL